MGAGAVPSAGDDEVQERTRLVQMARLQSKEIDALKVEINMLRRKGGNLYGTDTPAGASSESLERQAANAAGVGT